MKRNMVPLLGIAVVVAIISTGVFYGLFAGKLRSSSADLPGQPVVVAARDLERGAELQPGDVRVSQFKGTIGGSFSSPEQLAGATLLGPVKQNEPLLGERVVSKLSKAGGSNGRVPAGMRAVTIHVSDSDSLMDLLRPGAKVDLQAVQEHHGGLELRTILQNAEVLAVNRQPQPSGGNRGPVLVVTILTRAPEADLVALADTGSRLRLALRNPLDEQTTPGRSLALGSIFQSNGPIAAEPAEARKTVLNAGPDAASIQLHVQVLRASAAAVSELESNLIHAASGGSFGVAQFRSGTDGGQLVRNLEQRREVEIISAKSLTAGLGHPARFRAGSGACQLRMQLSAESGALGELNLRVRPEISFPSAGGVETRVYEAELPASAGFVVTGLLDAASDHAWLERLFPEHAWSNGRLVILVTSQAAAKSAAPAVARTSRGH